MTNEELNQLVRSIASHLKSMSQMDMSAAERRIANLLVEAKIGYWKNFSHDPKRSDLGFATCEQKKEGSWS